MEPPEVIELNGNTAIELAFERGNYEIVLNLLKTNYCYPSNFNTEIISEELKYFVKLSEDVHASIMEDNIDDIEQIMMQSPSLKHFYNIENKSALRVALENKKFQSYEALVFRNLTLGPHEIFDDLISCYLSTDLRNLKEIHLRTAPGACTKPMLTLNKNSYFGPNCPNGQEHRNSIIEAYNYLFMVVGLTSIFNAVDASRTLKLVFDFSREAVNYIDPTADGCTEGVTYFSGKIFIGAKTMLNSARKFEVFGRIAHELTHYALYLTYNNWAKPYRKNDKRREIEFYEIVKECERSKVEQLVNVVFEAFDEDVWPAELIVCVPHMMALYHNQPEILAQRKQVFALLFNFFEQNCVPDIEKALPKIKRKFRSEKEKKIMGFVTCF